MSLLSFIRDAGEKIFENPAAVAGAAAAPARERRGRAQACVQFQLPRMNGQLRTSEPEA